jgi:hypothetical protein
MKVPARGMLVRPSAVLKTGAKKQVLMPVTAIISCDCAAGLQLKVAMLRLVLHKPPIRVKKKKNYKRSVMSWLDLPGVWLLKPSTWLGELLSTGHRTMCQRFRTMCGGP